MKNQLHIEEKQEQKYIPAISFLLAVPVGILSAFFVQGQAPDLAVLNQKVLQLFPQAFADDIIQFQNDGQWVNNNGGMILGDHSNHSNHSNHSSCDDGDDDGGSDGL